MDETTIELVGMVLLSVFIWWDTKSISAALAFAAVVWLLIGIKDELTRK